MSTFSKDGAEVSAAHYVDLCTELDTVGRHLISSIGNTKDRGDGPCEKFLLNTEPRQRALLAAYPGTDPEYSLSFDDQRDLITPIQIKALTVFDEIAIAFCSELIEELCSSQTGLLHQKAPDFMIRIERLQHIGMVSGAPTFVLTHAHTWLLRLVLSGDAEAYNA